MKQILRYAALVILLTGVFFIANAMIDDNDYWKPCTEDAFGVVTCVFVETTARRGGEVYMTSHCTPPVLVTSMTYERTCTHTPNYFTRLIGNNR